MKQVTPMRKNIICDWLPAILPALLLLVLRLALKSLPPAVEIGLTCVVLALSVCWYRRVKKTSAPRLSFPCILLCVVFGAACGALSRLCFGKPANLPSGVPGFLLLCFLGPLTEEIVYRGLVYEQLLRFLPESGAILLNSLLFGVAHGTPVQMVSACLAGLLFSLMRKKTGTIAAPILMHIALNAAVFLL